MPMSLSSALYQLLIGPIEIIFEAIYGFSSMILDNYGLSIIVLSLVMNLLLLPFYMRADAIQDEERAAEQRMANGVAHIKKVFKGDERFMMLQTYYRQNNYRPYYTLKGFLPLVLEIPFFIAAYHFLSNYPPLVGATFGPIRDLGQPDALLRVAGVSINLLPILMTAINGVSSAIYTKGFPLRDKLQLYAMALVFLVLLYKSPSALVLYWTLNNLFSLTKNLICRIKNYRQFLSAALAVGGTALLVFALVFYQTSSWKHRLLFSLVAVCMLLPAALAFLKKKGALPRLSIPKGPDPKLFLCATVFMAILTGLLIPSAVIRSSPEEFVHLSDYYSPLRHLLNASLLSFGFFVIWLGIFYYMVKDRAKWAFGLILWVVAGVSIVDYMFFGTGLGLISAELKYDDFLEFSFREHLINCAVVAILAILMFLVYLKRQKIVVSALSVLLAVTFCMSGVNALKIQTSMAGFRDRIGDDERQAEFTLSRNGKNVVFIMLDRAIGFYVPYLLEENPELRQQFSGFTYYPNTVSFGSNTAHGSPALWGGYEYTPEEINKRTSERMVDKQNEALKVMPVLFSEAGYQVTVCDPPIAGYKWIPDMSIYDGYGINTYYLEQPGCVPESVKNLDQIWKRNFFCYSIMKCAPTVLQWNIYDHGEYYGLAGAKSAFTNSALSLKSFPAITKISDGDENTFLALCNSITHSRTLLSVPSYELPGGNLTMSSYSEEQLIRTAEGKPTLYMDTELKLSHYHVNMAALMLIGDWLDYLKEQGVYDNTRIIIGSDHGYYIDQFPELMFDHNYGGDGVFSLNPLMLVKDFDSDGFTIDPSFMTHADVPTFAVEGLIPDAVNPFTGKPLNSDAKAAPEQLVTLSHDWNVTDDSEYGGCTFPKSMWYSVHDDIFDMSNWTYVGTW